MTIWRSRGSYSARGQFRAYMFTIAKRRCQNVRRAWARHANECEAGEREPALHGEADQLDVLIVRERQRLLQKRVAQLSTEQQHAIQLHFAAGLEYAEIAAICKRPAATIRTRVFLALKRLRALARRQGDLP